MHAMNLLKKVGTTRFKLEGQDHKQHMLYQVPLPTLALAFPRPTFDLTVKAFFTGTLPPFCPHCRVPKQVTAQLRPSINHRKIFKTDPPKQYNP